MAEGDSESTRLSQYKSRKTSSCQEERRRRLLEEQKRLRSEAFNESRNIIEASESLHQHVHERNKFYRRKLMLSEWLLELPSDFEENWVMVPCPVGKRVLVLAGRGTTLAFAKDGCVLGRFRSNLPGGHSNSGEPTKGVTLLDCIWSKSNRSYYILDVLAWNNQCFNNCDAEFRFYWLQTKLIEIDSISEISGNNAFSFYLLPSYPCNMGILETVLNSDSLVADVSIDGLLFYHLRAHYIAGSTPLVGWLKPFMIPDVLKFSVSVDLLYEKPENYTNYKKYINDYEEQQQKKKNLKRTGRFKKKPVAKMEVIETDELLQEGSNDNPDDSSESVMDLVENEVEDGFVAN